MTSARQKRVALLAAVLGSGVGLACLWDSRGLLLENWYLWRLSSGNADARRTAAEALGTLRSAKAAPDLFTISLRDPEEPVREAATEALVNIGAGAVPALSAELGAEPVWMETTLRQSLPAGSTRLEDFSRVEQALRILLRVHGADGTTDFLQNVGLPGGSGHADPRRGKSLVWRSGVVTLDGTQCRVFVFDREGFKSWPGSQPQTICVADASGKLETWKEVGGEPMYASSTMEERDGKVILRITCEERRHPGPGIYSYGISRAGIELLGADYPGA
jgi:hypothetical protein